MSAHEGGLLGEDPNGIPNNLVPYIAPVAAGKLAHLQVFGSDDPTPDGTGVRDYIHVLDLAEGHLAALRAPAGRAGVAVWNSVLEVMGAFEAASGRSVPFEVLSRRASDVAA